MEGKPTVVMEPHQNSIPMSIHVFPTNCLSIRYQGGDLGVGARADLWLGQQFGGGRSLSSNITAPHCTVAQLQNCEPNFSAAFRLLLPEMAT